MTKRIKSTVLALILGMALVALGGCGGPAVPAGGSPSAPVAASAL
jgi:hypothetical protein